MSASTSGSLLDAAAVKAADVSAVRAAANDHLRHHRWAQAADLLGALAAHDAASAIQLRLARNMAALREARPAIYDELTKTPTRTRCQLVQLERGQLSIQQELLLPGAGDKPRVLSTSPDPAAALANILRQVEPHLARAAALTVCGFGDGYFIESIARMPPPAKPVAPGMQSAIFLIEPDFEVITHCFMIHDLSGPTGAIRQQRCYWFVGPDWRAKLACELARDLYLPGPAGLFGQGLRQAETIPQARAAFDGVSEIEDTLGRRVHEAYTGFDRKTLIDVLGPTPSRKPRVVLLTSRFTTVLQYSTRDVARAMEGLGWETRVFIEPTPWHSTSDRALKQLLIDFKPDLVFSIDHLRRENPSLYPDELPYVCWIQDDMPNLTCTIAGRSIGRRDFVLCADELAFNLRYDYPLRQNIYVHKFTRVPERPATWKADGDDLAFVSNTSRLPRDIADEAVAGLRVPEDVRRLVRAACDRMIATYETGGAFHAFLQVRRLIESLERELNIPIESRDSREQLILFLFNHLNNALYRQQTLRWIADAADALGLKLGLYGKGWDNHPAFARFARGSVRYGDDLERLTRATKINLQILPYSCLHQRLLDGLVAGGFFLIRAHPLDISNVRLSRLVREHVPPDVRTLADARKRLTGDALKTLEEILDANVQYLDPPPDDAIAYSHAAIEKGLSYLYEVLPRLEDVTFNNADEARALIARYIADPSARESVGTEQRHFVESYHTYTYGLRRVLSRIHALIAREETDGLDDNRPLWSRT